ncbi:MAG: hypothetical protein SAK29_03370 [Scytonema sp. PMC 1069.18]|nr:hypothetical protein [Scytonema sp. PMC 1069.18]MEC4881982.1 hypothetical protein [Scytonema sp. PMC 1070.18]
MGIFRSITAIAKTCFSNVPSGTTGENGNHVVHYTATSLDGQPISLSGDTSIQGNIVFVPNAELVGLSLFAIDFDVGMCKSQ